MLEALRLTKSWGEPTGSSHAPDIFWLGLFLAARREGNFDALNPLYVLEAAPFSDAFLALTVALLIALVAALGLRSGFEGDEES